VRTVPLEERERTQRAMRMEFEPSRTEVVTPPTPPAPQPVLAAPPAEPARIDTEPMREGLRSVREGMRDVGKDLSEAIRALTQGRGADSGKETPARDEMDTYARTQGMRETVPERVKEVIVDKDKDAAREGMRDYVESERTRPSFDDTTSAPDQQQPTSKRSMQPIDFDEKDTEVIAAAYDEALGKAEARIDEFAQRSVAKLQQANSAIADSIENLLNDTLVRVLEFQGART
jgi:hypothetical protein